MDRFSLFPLSMTSSLFPKFTNWGSAACPLFAHSASAHSTFSISVCVCLSLPQESRHLDTTRLFQGKRVTSKGWCIQAHTVTKHSETRKTKDLSSGWQAESSPGVKEKPATLKCNFPHPIIEHANRSSKATSLTVDTSCATTWSWPRFLWEPP